MGLIDGEERLKGIFIAAVLTATLAFSMGFALLFTQPVSAAFPGANGKIAFSLGRVQNEFQ